MNHFNLIIKLPLVIAICILLSHPATAQTGGQPDSIKVQTDSSKTEKKKEDEKKKKHSAYIVYTGINFNDLNIESDQYSSNLAIGWHLGAAYKRGGFFYWQAGLRFNSAQYDLLSSGSISDTLGDKFSVNDLDIPITGGINFLAFINSLANFRLFVSAVPSFALSVSDNKLEIEKSDINTFNFYGQAGLGVDVLFLVIEGGVNYGFIDLLQNDIKSKPVQIFINLGARF